ncbi:putative Flavonol synthase/flavanone 3-hydroxylase [Corchorus olitorius]|uniref:Flavonol synthase/flavanone 3-hydroxylase n=1 Tax=Corchorus olitorius TaxID=93759 RepID=A0A1R3GZN6_9ROSI|nr:putative Flavonol synthase/flavanone 3-hydroxylase [Corchorus olitorius]
MTKAIIEASKGFFELREEEKQEFEAKHVMELTNKVWNEFQRIGGESSILKGFSQGLHAS